MQLVRSAYVGIHIFFGSLMALLYFGRDFMPRVVWMLLLVLFVLCVAALVLYQVTKRNSDSQVNMELPRFGGRVNWNSQSE